MVSTTLTTIVSTATATPTNNRHYQSSEQAQSGRNFYFSTTFNDPKTTSTISNSVVTPNSHHIQQYQQHYHQQQQQQQQHQRHQPIINSTGSTTSFYSTTVPTLTSSYSNPIGLNNISGIHSISSIDGINSTNSNNLNNQVKNSDPLIVTSTTTNSVLTKSSSKNSCNEISAISTASTANTTCIASLLSSSSSASPPPLSDQISLLFPKCRPKNDTNLNAFQNNKTTNSSSPLSSSSKSLESLSSVTPRISTNPFLNSTTVNLNHQQEEQQLQFQNQERYTPLNSLQKPQTNNNTLCNYYNSLSASPQNTIQSQSVSNNSLSSSHIDMPRKRNYHISNQNPFIKENYWQTRHNITPASTVLNSPELTVQSENRNNFISKQHIKVGRSPVSHSSITNAIDATAMDSLSANLDSSTKGVAVVAEGEIVVFDDITENWQNLRVTSEEIPISLTINKEEQLHNNEMDGNNESKSLDRNSDVINDTRHGIMEYEGSPRKIGQTVNDDQQHEILYNQHQQQFQQNQQQNSNMKHKSSPLLLYTARPGFPQRIISPLQESPPPILNTKQSNNAEDTSNDVSEIGTSSDLTTSEKEPKSTTFDYLYEFSETRKVLEEFFKCPSNEEKAIENGSDVDSIDIHYEFRNNVEGHRLANSPLLHQNNDIDIDDSDSPCLNNFTNGTSENGVLTNRQDHNNHNIDFFLDSASRSSGDQIDNQDGINQNIQSRSFRYSPETTDYDSNCGDLDSLSGEFNGLSTYPSYTKYYAASMPVLEDGLSSGHASDTENNNPPATGISMLMDMKRASPSNDVTTENNIIKPSLPNEICCKTESPTQSCDREISNQSSNNNNNNNNSKVFKNIDPELDSLYSISVFHRSDNIQLTPPPPAPVPHRKPSVMCPELNIDVSLTSLKNLRSTLQRAKTIPSGAYEKLPARNHTISHQSSIPIEKIPAPIEKIPTSPVLGSPVWVPRRTLETNSKTSLLVDNDQSKSNLSADEEEVDTDLETDRLLGHQRLDDKGFYDDNKTPWDRKPRSLLTSSLSKFSPKVQHNKSAGSSLLRQGLNSLLPTTSEIVTPSQKLQQQQYQQQSQSQQPPSTNKLLDISESMSSPDHSEKSSEKSPGQHQTISSCNIDSPDGSNKLKQDCEKKIKKSKNKEGNQPVLIEGVLFRARYLGSTQLVCEGQPTKSTRMMQAEEAVSRIKAPDGDVQPSTEVDLFISTEKIMVLNTDLKEIMMDHALRTISYIADIGDLVVLMARRRFVPQDIDDGPKPNRTPKMICHVFESDEAQFIAQSIGQAFQVAYMEFLKANGIEDHSFVKEMDYQEVLNSQEIFGDELEIFAKKELQKEVVVPKAKGEILGVVIVESGWGSMLPTVVIANLMSSGAAARCGQLNIGDQLIAINGLSLVGLPLSTCQNYIKNAKNQTVVKFTVVPCPPVVEVKIKRPNTKYQLGFSVQNGVICSLLRGGIAERGGVRVGHRIIEINNQSVVAVPHEKIVNLLATSVGEILMKTMPTSMFRLLTGQENPIYI